MNGNPFSRLSGEHYVRIYVCSHPWTYTHTHTQLHLHVDVPPETLGKANDRYFLWVAGISILVFTVGVGLELG